MSERSAAARRISVAHLARNLTERIAEAREPVWLGEVAGLQQTLVALWDKTKHTERLATAGITDTLGAADLSNS